MAELSLPRGFSLPSFSLPSFRPEAFVRQAVTAESFLRDRTPPPPDVVPPPAQLVWGKGSQFRYTASQTSTDGFGHDIIIDSGGGDDDDEPDTPPAEGEAVFNEVQRQITVVRIVQEGNAENWVDVERIEQISFDAPSNLVGLLQAALRGEVGRVFFTFKLNNRRD
jgi:hypothetical protein